MEYTTTFWMDFSIADRFGKDAIQETYDMAFAEWKHDHKYLTDLVLVLNHKIWQWWEKGNHVYAELYDRLWREAQAYALNNLKGDELRYYLEVTD